MRGGEERKDAKERRDATSVSENEIARVTVDAAVEVHRTLGGPGLLEKLYEEALVHELRLRRLQVERQVPVPVLYKGLRLSSDLRVDIVVEGIVLVECKAAEENHSVFLAHALTYLRLTGLKLALVINFGQPTLKNGILRVVNGL